jgi:flagellar basal-body rod protein FlgB
MRRADPEHLKGIPKLNRVNVETREDMDSVGPDGNNVDLEREMTSMAQNVLKFSVVSRLFSHKLYMVKSSIKEGKG